MEITILVERTPPPEGTITVDRGPTRAFGGWLELLAGLEDAVGMPRESGAPAGDLAG